MARRTGFSTLLLAAVLAAPHLVACTFSARTGEADSPPPPPPPPPPAATAQPAAEQPPATPPADQPAQTQTPAQPKLTTKGSTVQMPGNLVFETDKAVLKQGAGNEKLLDQLVQFLKDNPQVTKLRIEGHTDNAGEAAYNEKLAGDRAVTVGKWLVEKGGVKKERLIAVGFGERKPIASNATEEGKAQNRRIEFKIAEQNGKPYLGMDVTGGGTKYDL